MAKKYYTPALELKKRRAAQSRVKPARKRSESAAVRQSLSETNAFFTAVLDAQPAQLMILDESGLIQFSNAAWDRFWLKTGSTNESIHNQNYLDVCDFTSHIQSHDSANTAKRIRSVLHAESDFEMLTFARRIGAEQCWFTMEISAFQTDPERRFAVVVTREITAEQKSQKALHDVNRENSRLATIISKTANAVVLTDVDRRITWVNDGFEKITGYRLNEVIGESPGRILQFEKTDRRTIEAIRAALDAQMPFQGRLLNRAKSGREYWLEIDIQPSFDEKGRLEGFMAIERDITELMTTYEAAEAALREVSALRFALDQHALLSITDENGQIIEVNAGFCRVSGYTRSELLGQNHRLLSSNLHTKEFWSSMWQTVLSGNPWRSEVRNRSKDGEHYWVDTTVIPKLDANGKIEKLVSLLFDITDKKKGEEALRIANQKFRLLAAAVDRSPDITVVTDREGIVRFANPAAIKFDALFGYELRIGAPALLFRDNQMDSSLREQMVQTVLSGDVFIGQFQCQWDRSENTLHFEQRPTSTPVKILAVTASPLVNEDGEIDGILLVKRDVTQEVTRQRSLEEITKAMDAATDYVYILDAKTRLFVYANQGAMKHLGYQWEDLRNMTPLDLNPQLNDEKFEKLVEPLFNAPNTAINFRTEHCHRDGRRIPVAVSLQLIPQLGENGRFLAIVRDIAEQLNAEAALEEAREMAESSNRTKSEFLANMSHEIRTPMTAILGFADLLDSNDEFAHDPQLASNAVQTIRNNANHLLCIINDILDMSKIEAGKMTVEQIPFSPAAIVNDVVALLENRAVGKGIKIQVEYETKIPSLIQSDPTRLRQILINLMGNAIKFTEVGCVTVKVAIDSESNMLRFRVVDTGIGMSPEHCAQIERFDAFVQADGSTTRQFGGTGLGLRISNSFAEMLGERIHVESQLGIGSTFSFAVSLGNHGEVQLVDPTQVPSVQHFDSDKNADYQHDASTSAALKGCRILLAEDGPDNQRLIAFHLRKAGAEVTIAENGRIAMDLLLKSKERFDMVFMDMQMPELDGYEATRQLRQADCRLPIIALTAHAMETDRQKCIDVGCNDYTTKPISRSELIKLAIRYGRSITVPSIPPALKPFDCGIRT